jgi:hypothetical protein
LELLDPARIQVAAGGFLERPRSVTARLLIPCGVARAENKKCAQNQNTHIETRRQNCLHPGLNNFSIRWITNGILEWLALFRATRFHHPMKAFLLLTITCLLAATKLSAAETLSLAEPLEPFRPLLGKTWRGEFKNSRPDKPMIDVARWERALNGKAVRVLHSVNDGAYGGETIIQWDQAKREIVYHYFTTAGFFTTGTMTVADGKFISREKVVGSTNGVTEVRATTELRPDGTLLSKAEYLKNGEPSGGREVLYQEDPKAEVKFK